MHVFAVPFVLAASSGGGGTSGFDVVSVMSESVSSVQGQLLSVLAVVVPAIVVVTGAVVGVKFGIKWFRKLGN